MASGSFVMSTAARALVSLESDDLAREVFRLFDDSTSVSGWSAVKSLNKPPAEVELALLKLSQSGVLKADGTGLDAFYYLTSSGYRVRDLLRGS